MNLKICIYFKLCISPHPIPGTFERPLGKAGRFFSWISSAPLKKGSVPDANFTHCIKAALAAVTNKTLTLGNLKV